jgi:hypothetical protein
MSIPVFLCGRPGCFCTNEPLFGARQRGGVLVPTHPVARSDRVGTPWAGWRFGMKKSVFWMSNVQNGAGFILIHGQTYKVFKTL